MRSLKLLTAITLVLAWTMVQSGCGSKANANEKKPAMPVTVVKVEQRDIPDLRNYPGNTQAILEAYMVARVEGFLEKRLFEEGMDVSSDDMLFLIQQEPYEAKVQQAQAEVLDAEVQVAYARTEYERNQPLADTGAISKQEWDGYVRNLESSVAQFESAQAGLEMARINFGYTEVRAPFDGRIGRRLVDVGNLVGPGENENLALLVQLDPMRVIFEPPGTELVEYLGIWPSTKVPVTVQFQASGGNTETFQGELDLVDNSLNPATSTFVARAQFPNPDRKVLPGLFASVQVKMGTLKNQLVVPGEAIYSELQMQYVWAVNSKNTLVRKPVKVTRTYQGMSLITGLDKGEMVVVQGNPMALQPDTPVSPTVETVDAFIAQQSKNATAANDRVSGSGAGSASSADASSKKDAEKSESKSSDKDAKSG